MNLKTNTENSKLFLQAFKGVDLDALCLELLDDFMIDELAYRLPNLEAFLVYHSKEIATFYKLKARDELNKAQNQFKFMENL